MKNPGKKNILKLTNKHIELINRQKDHTKKINLIWKNLEYENKVKQIETLRKYCNENETLMFKWINKVIKKRKNNDKSKTWKND